MHFKALLSSMFLILVLPLHSFQQDDLSVIAEKGVFTVREDSFSGKTILRLDGQWKFFRETFITVDERRNVQEELISVPGSWHSQTDYPAHGFGTYSLEVKGLEEGEIYTLYMSELISSYRLFINGREMGGNGLTGSSRRNTKPQFLPRVVSFSASREATEILIHVSNFDYRNSGIWRSLYIGREEGINYFKYSRVILEVIIAAILFSIALFHIGVYISRNQEKAEFLFGLICLTFVIRTLCTGEQVLTFLIPSLPWELMRKLEYIPFYGSAPLLALFMATLFPEEASPFFQRLLMVIFSIYGILVFILPVRVSNHFIPFIEVIVVLGLLYALWVLARALKANREEAPLLTTAYILFLISVINDILYASQIIQSFYLAPYGFVVFMIIQSQMLIGRYSRSFTQREQLARSRDMFKEASITDSLTGLFNVRYLHKFLYKEINSSRKSGTALSLLMADVDNFKNYNDTRGHKQGDEVLKKMGEILRSSAREKDVPCRYGGEEFSLILPETTLEKALEVSERIRSRFECAGEKDERMEGITISIGVAQYKGPESGDELIERADKALYKAKELGKNRVVRAL